MVEIIVAVIGVIGLIASNIITTRASVKKENKEQQKEIGKILEEIKTQINNLDEKVDKHRVDSLKNFLVVCLDDIESGNELRETTKERFYESLRLYSDPVEKGGLGQNSYIHARVEKLQKEGKL